MHFLAAEESAPNVLQVPLVELVIGGLAFLIVFGALAKWVLPGVKKTLAERTDQIEGGMQRAEAAQAEATDVLEQYRAQLAQARTEAAEIRAQAQADRLAIIEEARTEAAAAAEQVTRRAQEQLVAETQAVRGQLTRDVGRLSVDLAGRIVGESLADDDRVRGTVDRFIADLESVSAPGSGSPDAGVQQMVPRRGRRVPRPTSDDFGHRGFRRGRVGAVRRVAAAR